MKDVRVAIARNLSVLRKDRGLTQAELAEKFNYSDKAVSRWEHGDTLPDVNVLCELCEFYGITLNDLVAEDPPTPQKKQRSRNSAAYRVWLCITSGAMVWLLATIVFLCLLTVREVMVWQIFVFAVPFSCLAVCLLCRSMCVGLVQFILQSIIVWTLITAVYLQFFDYRFWFLFLLGIPLQLIVFLSYKLRQFK